MYIGHSGEIEIGGEVIPIVSWSGDNGVCPSGDTVGSPRRTERPEGMSPEAILAAYFRIAAVRCERSSLPR